MHTFSYICIDIKIKIYIYKLIWFRTGIKARFASHLVQNGDSKRVSRVIWFRTGLFKARFASQLVQFGLQSANHLLSSGLQSANI